MRPVRALPLLILVAALAAALVLPCFVFSGVTLWNWVSVERGRLEAQTGELNDDVVTAIDRFLGRQIATLQALATSPALDDGDLLRFDRQARDLLSLQGVNIVLRDPSGQQRVNTRLPWGSQLPRGSTGADAIVAETRTPYVSDLFSGSVTRQNQVSVTVPVLRGGRVVSFLSASVAPRLVAELIAEAGIKAPYSSTIADRDGRIIARWDGNPDVIGQRLPGFDRAPGPRGEWSGVNTQGIAVFATYRRSPLSGWLVAVGVDRAALIAPLRRSGMLLGGLAVVLSLLAVVTSGLITRRIVEAHRSLIASTRDLRAGAARV